MLKKIIIGFVLFFLSFTFNTNISYADDALDQVFEESKDYQIVTEKINDTHVESWFQKTMKTMLKISIMIGVAVFLYGGIRFLLSFGDDGKAKKTRDTLITSALGFIIAFGAWAILQVMMSVGTTLTNSGL